jgi:SAM-dependent methyltransferase
MHRAHFEAFGPVCPCCGGQARLVLARIFQETAGNIVSGILHCPTETCRHEYPIVDSVPLIVPDLARLLTDRGVELFLRRDLPDALESLLGDAIGPDSWLDALRQTHSTYAWDSYAALDPAEAEPPQGAPTPGAAARCLAQLLTLAGETNPGRVLDLGCAAGGTSFALAAAHPGALVLGLDTNLGLLRLAQRAASGTVSYPRRRIGLVYDRRDFPVSLPGAERVDFWACDATALPFAAGTANLAAALNLLDCVPEPSRLLAELARILAPGGDLLLATPYDWSTRATGAAHWIGGHSQRAPHRGAAEDFLRALLTDGAHPSAVPGLALRGEIPRFAWQTRLHDRSAVHYASHLLALRRDG